MPSLIFRILKIAKVNIGNNNRAFLLFRPPVFKIKNVMFKFEEFYYNILNIPIYYVKLNAKPDLESSNHNQK